MIKSTLDTILEFITAGETESALKLLLQEVKGTRNYTKVVQISSRFEEIKKDTMLGIINDSERIIESNKITKSLIDITNSIKNEESREKNRSNNKIKIIFSIVGLLALSLVAFFSLRKGISNIPKGLATQFEPIFNKSLALNKYDNDSLKNGKFQIFLDEDLNDIGDTGTYKYYLLGNYEKDRPIEREMFFYKTGEVRSNMYYDTAGKIKCLLFYDKKKNVTLKLTNPEYILDYEIPDSLNYYSIVYEPFKEDIKFWTKYDDNNFTSKIDNGKFQIQDNDVKYNRYWYISTPSFEKYDFSIKVTTTLYNSNKEGSGYGLVWGAKDIKHKYSFLITNNGFFGFFDDLKDETSGDFEKSDVINKKSKNTIEIQRSGQNISGIINGKLVKTIPFGSFYGNEIGFYISGQQSVSFENFSIKIKKSPN